MLELVLDKKNEYLLYFLHIPKTAGTTLIDILEKNFPSESILGPQSWKQLSHNMPKDFSQFRLIKGHFGYGVYRILPKMPIYITMLRQPEEVIISHLKMLMRQPAPRKKFNISNNDTVSELILRPVFKGLINPQAHWLVADLDVVSLTKGLDLKLLDRFLPEDQDEFMLSDISDKKLLEIAKERLSEFAFFGLVERFEDSLMLLYYTFGWRPSRYLKKLNTAPNNSLEELSSEAKVELAKKTKLDTELYKFAQQLFDVRYSQMIKELKEKYYESSLDNLTISDMVYEMLKKRYFKKIGRIKFLIQEYHSKYLKVRSKIANYLNGIKRNVIKIS